ncbi:hypothetical protein FisN_3Hh553 [Fistulifera solaris]|uniref:Roadblock/LAMTOR2 domain-containing protein n=1 Tax=Fistulifera solaris TaxID=1519565 RepID=A0A1Z5K335_FISSO|nr:hypothetical protein FisN_3Hh553 [Fistulifera solaris]|eukprot:GAX20596.1 hypothetical protein FisN_3Hh553 [Fistulifera solaris]
MSLLPISLQSSLQEIVRRCHPCGADIRAILLSTTEGVPLGRILNTPLNEEILASIESVWAPASKQFSVLGLGKVQQATAIYDHGTLIHLYQGPLVITILCGESSNLGAVRSTAIPLLKQVLEPLGTTLLNSLKPDWQEEETHFATTSNATYYQ